MIRAGGGLDVSRARGGLDVSRAGGGRGVRRVVAAAQVAVCLAFPAVAEGTSPSPAQARLEGVFLMTGRVTAASRIIGEHVGQTVHRRWVFRPLCPVGPCARIELMRERSAGTDRVILRRRAPGLYTGRGSFSAPVRCDGRRWRGGIRVPFTIIVRVTAAALLGDSVLATALRAWYVNRHRINETPCVAGPLGHDAARYVGRLETGPGGG